MPNRLQDKVAVVSGGASGIGAATARFFVAEGARVVVADLQEPVDPQLLSLIDANPDRIRFIKCDVSIEEQVVEAIEAAVTSFGKLDTVVACAGVPGMGAAGDISSEHWDRTFAINARGVFLFTKYAIPHMIEAGGGSIINISSAFGIVAGPHFAAYAASKGAVRNFSKATALDYIGQGIRSNSIHPGYIDTPIVQNIINNAPDAGAAQSMFNALQPGGRAGVPEDIAWGCVYLASDEARFVTGAELVIDGGLLAR
jgi:NAD(P)-dependent dehydrogenase (short-subunit alcohol dehydrogenase family)